MQVADYDTERVLDKFAELCELQRNLNIHHLHFLQSIILLYMIKFIQMQHVYTIKIYMYMYVCIYIYIYIYWKCAITYTLKCA